MDSSSLPTAFMSGLWYLDFVGFPVKKHLCHVTLHLPCSVLSLPTALDSSEASFFQPQWFGENARKRTRSWSENWAINQPLKFHLKHFHTKTFLQRSWMQTRSMLHAWPRVQGWLNCTRRVSASRPDQLPQMGRESLTFWMDGLQPTPYGVTHQDRQPVFLKFQDMGLLSVYFLGV